MVRVTPDGRYAVSGVTPAEEFAYEAFSDAVDAIEALGRRIEAFAVFMHDRFKVTLKGAEPRWQAEIRRGFGQAFSANEAVLEQLRHDLEAKGWPSSALVVRLPWH